MMPSTPLPTDSSTTASSFAQRNRTQCRVLAFTTPTALSPFFPPASFHAAASPSICPPFHVSPYLTTPHSTTSNSTTRNYHHPSLRSAAAAPSPTSEQSGNGNNYAPDAPALKKPRPLESLQQPPFRPEPDPVVDSDEEDDDPSKLKSHDNDDVDPEVHADADSDSDTVDDDDDLQLEDFIHQPADAGRRQQHLQQQDRNKSTESADGSTKTRKARSISETVDVIEQRLIKELNLQRTVPNPASSTSSMSPSPTPVSATLPDETQMTLDTDSSDTLSSFSSPSSSSAPSEAATASLATEQDAPTEETSTDGSVVDEVRPLLSLSERLRLEGHEAEIKGEHYLASQIYFRSIKLDSSNGKAWQNLAKTEGRRKRSLKATATILKKALKYNPYNAYIWQSLGFILFRMRKYEEAREHFQTGITRNSKHAPLYSTWAHLEYALKNITRARELYEMGAKIDDGGSRVYHNWGQMELKLGNEKKALYLFELGLRLEPFNSFIWETLGTFAWKKKNDFKKARQCYQNALKSSNINVIVFDSWAKLEASLENVQQARLIFQKGVDFDSRDARLLTSFAQFEFRNDELDEAKKLIEKAVLLAPTDHVLWTQYAKIEAALGHYPRARAMFNRACEINAKDWKSWDAWSIMEHQLGNYQQAEKLVHESFRVRFNAKGDFTVLANSVQDKEKND